MFLFSVFMVIQNALIFIMLAYVLKRGNYQMDISLVVMLFYTLSNFLYVIFNR